MKRKTFFAVFLALLIIGTVIPVCSLAEEETFTVTFTEGIKLINPLTGKKPTNIFTGTEVPPITVEAGGSFVFPENTVIFRDYVFDGWKYTYTDEDGKKQTELYQPGDTYENVTSDMEFGVNWKRPDPIELVITGYLTFVNTESYVDGDCRRRVLLCIIPRSSLKSQAFPRTDINLPAGLTVTAVFTRTAANTL